MKKICLLVCWIFLLLATVKSAPITENEAKNIAKSFCFQKGIDEDLYLSEVERDGCYIFNSRQGGYVIVSADDKVIPILGYSKTGSIRPDMMSFTAFSGWLNCLEENFDSILPLMNDSQVDKSEWEKLRSGEMSSSLRCFRGVAPMIKTTWDQGKPFNSMCPDGSMVGCVALAMGQIMKYYSHPKVGVGESQEYVTSTNKDTIPSVSLEVEYDWDNMLENYGGEYTKEEEEAVSTLLYHCGVASFMDFNSKTSATSFKKAAKAFYSHFDYDKSLRLIKRDVCSDEEWHAILKGQLDNGRPLIYSGSDENFLNAHAFVCDGYDENDYYHFNFGWGGVMDGYFTVDFILPSLGTSTENIHDFSYKQEVLVNIFPNENGSFFYDFFYENPECFSISADTIKNSSEVEILSRFYYQGLETFKGVLFAELLDSSGHPLDTLFKSHVLIPSSSSYVKRLKFGFDLFPNGVYYISCGLKDDSGKVYKIREMQDSVAYRKFVVDFPEEDPADRFEFVYGHPSDFVVSSDSVCLGDDVIKVNCNFINLSRNAFKGSLRLDITDEEGNEVASLDSETFNMVSKGCFFYQWEFETDDIPLGDYFLEVFVLDEKGKEYEVKDRGNATSVRTFRVVPKKEPELPEPEYTSSEFVLQQESDYSISVDSVVNDRYYTTLRYNIYNSSDLDFKGFIFFESVDDKGEVVCNFRTDTMEIKAKEVFRSGIVLIRSYYPEGDYTENLNLMNEVGAIIRVRDVDGTIAKRPFTIGAIAAETLTDDATSQDSLRVATCDNCLVLYSDSRQEVVIYDLYGRIVKELVVEGSCNVELSSGFYLVKSKDAVIKVVL